MTISVTRKNKNYVKKQRMYLKYVKENIVYSVYV